MGSVGGPGWSGYSQPTGSARDQTDNSGCKARKPYTITKQRERWSDEEHSKFLEALRLYGRAWRKIEDYVGTKTSIQIRSHAQKFFSKVERNKEPGAMEEVANVEVAAIIPPPRPKRKPSRPYPKKEHSGSANGGEASCLHFGHNGGGDAAAGGGAGRAVASHHPHKHQHVEQYQQYDFDDCDVSDETVAAVTAAASAAAAAAATAVIAAAGHHVQAQMQMHPPKGFPFFGMPPSLLAQASLRNPALEAFVHANGLASAGAQYKWKAGVDISERAAQLRGALAEATATTDGGEDPNRNHHPFGRGGDPRQQDSGQDSGRDSDGDSACSRETDDDHIGNGGDNDDQEDNGTGSGNGASGNDDGSDALDRAADGGGNANNKQDSQQQSLHANGGNASMRPQKQQQGRLSAPFADGHAVEGAGDTPSHVADKYWQALGLMERHGGKGAAANEGSAAMATDACNPNNQDSNRGKRHAVKEAATSSRMDHKKVRNLSPDSSDMRVDGGSPSSPEGAQQDVSGNGGNADGDGAAARQNGGGGGSSGSEGVTNGTEAAAAYQRRAGHNGLTGGGSGEAQGSNPNASGGNGTGSNGHGSGGGHGSNGQGSNGHGSNGQGSNGQGSNGHESSGNVKGSSGNGHESSGNVRGLCGGGGGGNGSGSSGNASDGNGNASDGAGGNNADDGDGSNDLQPVRRAAENGAGSCDGKSNGSSENNGMDASDGNGNGMADDGGDGSNDLQPREGGNGSCDGKSNDENGSNGGGGSSGADGGDASGAKVVSSKDGGGSDADVAGPANAAGGGSDAPDPQDINNKEVAKEAAAVAKQAQSSGLPSSASRNAATSQGGNASALPSAKAAAQVGSAAAGRDVAQSEQTPSVRTSAGGTGSSRRAVSATTRAPTQQQQKQASQRKAMSEGGQADTSALHRLLLALQEQSTFSPYMTPPSALLSAQGALFGPPVTSTTSRMPPSFAMAPPPAPLAPPFHQMAAMGMPSPMVTDGMEHVRMAADAAAAAQQLLLRSGGGSLPTASLTSGASALTHQSLLSSRSSSLMMPPPRTPFHVPMPGPGLPLQQPILQPLLPALPPSQQHNQHMTGFTRVTPLHPVNAGMFPVQQPQLLQPPGVPSYCPNPLSPGELVEKEESHGAQTSALLHSKGNALLAALDQEMMMKHLHRGL